jgi:hypothetical protein
MIGMLIQELNFHAEFFGAPSDEKRIRGRTTFSAQAVDELLGDGLLGPALLTTVGPSDFKHLDPSAVATSGEDQGDVKSEIAPCNARFSTTDLEVNKRLVTRMLRSPNASRMVKAKRIGLPISLEVIEALATAEKKAGREDHLDLAALRRRLSADGRANLAHCCGLAAELLSKPLKSVERESVSSFREAPPLNRFIVKLFALIAPTREWDAKMQAKINMPLHDIIISHGARTKSGRIGRADTLGPQMIEFAREGVKCADAVLASINFSAAVTAIDLNVDSPVLELSEHVQKKLKHDNAAWEAEPDDAIEDIAHRINRGRQLLIDRLWTVRQAALISNAYGFFLDWYLEHLRKKGMTGEDETFVALQQQVFALCDWSSEMRSRFEAGVASLRDARPRADGVPLPVKKSPPSIRRLHVTMAVYQDQSDNGAVPDRRILNDLWDAISPDFPHARAVWRKATEYLNPYPLIEKESSNPDIFFGPRP